MATFRLRRFSCPETFKAIEPKALLQFLFPFQDFFSSRGLVLPRDCASEDLDYEKLIRICMLPDSRTPAALIDALSFVDEMATLEGMDALLAEAKNRDLSLGSGLKHSPADVAVRVWLLDRSILERKHAEQHLLKVRSFESYQMRGSRRPTFKHPTPTKLMFFERDLDTWFADRERGRGTKIFVCDRPDGIWFLVRHGDPLKREESLEGRDATCVCYRPLKYDVIVYSPQIRELRINARSHGEKQLYRSMFGKHVFGDENVFPCNEKYTLEPLRESGKDSLVVSDIDGIDWINLQELHLLVGGDPWEIVIRKADDLFASFEAREKAFPKSGRIIRAKFQIKFSDTKTPRSVVIKPSNIAQFTRDDDSVPVDAWLAARGFIHNQEAVEGDEAETVLAGA